MSPERIIRDQFPATVGRIGLNLRRIDPTPQALYVRDGLVIDSL